MQKSVTTCSFKTGLISVAKYLFATAIFGMIVLMVIATFVAAK